MSNFFSRLAVGTANFGLNYGINNRKGRVSDAHLKAIVDYAFANGINTFDTAEAYGDSERRLGKYLKSDYKVITKIGVDFEKQYSNGHLSSRFHKSLNNINIKNIYGLLLHRPEVLLQKNGKYILKELKNLKEENYIKKIGVSVYDPKTLNEVINLFTPDIVQFPFNIFDQRFVNNGSVKLLQSLGVEIHIRSVFLQGLLLMKQHELPEKFKSAWPKIFNNWFNYQQNVQLDLDEISLGYCLEQEWVDKIVVGIDNVDQLKRHASIEKRIPTIKYKEFNVEDESLINPSMWNKI